jgi:hypothetical protein
MCGGSGVVAHGKSPKEEQQLRRSWEKRRLGESSGVRASPSQVIPVTPNSLQSLPQVKNLFHVGYQAYGYDWRSLRTYASSEVITQIGGLCGWSISLQGKSFSVSKRGSNLVYEIYRVGENEYVMLQSASGEEGYTEEAHFR